MKYCVVITDGAADFPLESLGGQTPLEAARLPNIDALVQRGELGMVQTVPEGYSPGSDVAIMSLLGNSPVTYYTGRAPIEAAARKLPVKKNEWVFRCNLVSLVDGVMKDHSADNISNEEAAELMAFLGENLNTPELRFYSGVSYRNLLIIQGDFSGVETTPPHDILEKEALAYLPRGGEILNTLIFQSQELLKAHEINRKREARGLLPANSIWFWGQGTSPCFDSFKERFGLNGAVIAAVDLVRGIGHLMGWDVLDVEGATGFLDTNYKGKGDKAIEALENYDIVCVHIEAPDEAGHAGLAEEKVKALEAIDTHIVKPVVNHLDHSGEPWRLLLMPDHPTPCALRTHVHAPVLFTIAGEGTSPGGFKEFTEKEASQSSLYIDPGHLIMDRLLGK